MKKIKIILLTIVIIASSITAIYYFLLKSNENHVSVQGQKSTAFKDIGVLYMKPGVIPNSEFVFIKDPEDEIVTKKITGTDYYFEDTIKNKGEFVLSSVTNGNRAFIDSKNKVELAREKEKSGVSAIYEDENLVIKGLNDDLKNSTLLIKSNKINHQIKLVGYITQIDYDQSKHTAYIFNDFTHEQKSVLYTVNVETGELKEYSFDAFGSPKNFIKTSDEIIFSSEKKLSIFNKSTLTTRYIELPYSNTVGVHAYKDKYYVTFVEGHIVEYDKNFNLLKEYKNSKDSKVFRTKLTGHYLYSLSPGSFTENGENILYAHDLKGNLKESHLILPKKEMFSIDFKILNSSSDNS
ncbi:hypothetical protein [Bacillus sp. 166amftsu]|uniref:hypothetical protein n=1 Tax=Bacillus sp. 166amftsu TaxID=1761753 RepID=UPI0008943B9F|nr:hypothetical protein [Bacillus sp. 166amftsu]SDZ44991.1 hypothetical protein SAMN04488156_1487 [Bacillus sp. 166amftsu]